MSFVGLSEIALTVLCCAVLVQTLRLMRALRALKDGSLSGVVDALDRATGQARVVLADMKATLSDSAAAAEVVADGRSMADELGVMIGIANASAERLLEVATNRAPSGQGAEADQLEQAA